MENLVEEAIKRLGQVIVMGFDGTTLGESTSSFVRSASIGGIILFSRNYEHPEQLAELINQLQEQRPPNVEPLWIMVDHEGGRVQRFKNGFTRIPTAKDIAELDSPEATLAIAQVMAKELKSVGININLAPVADIMTNPMNPVIGDRAFGTTADDVIKHCQSMIIGHLLEGVQPCMKHFPGHGDTTLDSHVALPSVKTDASTLKSRELLPFIEGLKVGCNFVMSAHIIVQTIDAERPATLSKSVIQGLLREDLNFDGLVISDELLMGAITERFGVDDAPRLALEAGCDLLVYRTETAALIAYQSLVKACREGRLHPQVVIQASDRSSVLKQKVLLPYRPVLVKNVLKHVGTATNLMMVTDLHRERII